LASVLVMGQVREILLSSSMVGWRPKLRERL